MTEVAVAEHAEIATISFEDARALTDSIKQGREDLWELITRAYQTEAWRVLDYDSWDVYVATEFGDSRLALPREKRREKVQSLRDNGLSIRAIAAATGKAKSTVEADLNGGKPKKRASRNRDTTPAETEVIDGEVVAEVEDDPQLPMLTTVSVPVGEGFPDNMIGWGSPAAGAAILDADVVLFYGGEEVGVIRTGPARVLAAALLQAATHADAAAGE